MASPRFILLSVVGALTACAATSPDETELAAGDNIAQVGGAADAPGWDDAETLHANSPLVDSADAAHRNVHSLWIAGSMMNPVPLTISATAIDGADVRIAVLGPLVNGAREVLAADGYGSAKHTASLSLDVTTRGEHLVVVGSYDLAQWTSYELKATCSDCESRVDVLTSPKTLALVGNAQRLVQMQLGDVMIGAGTDVEVELWAAQPMQSWSATKIATSTASGNQVNAIIPDSVQPGDDLRLVVKLPGENGRALDTGVATRFVPAASAFARLDSIVYGDIASLQISGIAPFFEGVADLRLFSETYRREIAAAPQHASAAGQVGNGFNAFDATFMPDYSVAARDGELLSIGYLDGNGDYRRMGCFEYCNNLSGLSSCTGGPRACPTP
jgi:hypothetical protein